VPSSRKVLACATVIEEMLPLLPPDVSYEVLDFGLHVNPAALKQALQEAIDRAAGSADVDVIILGYGFCSMAVMGLRANGCTLVVPRVDDCIAIFLGSGAAYRQQVHSEPGTYYLTKGWIEVGDTGPGIPAEEQELIFAPFYRSNRLGRFPQGMGLGLTIARDLTAAHGGRLQVRSTPGDGSHFIIRLPVPD